MAINFTMFTATPTQAFLDAIKAAGITVRGWEIPPYRFRRRKTLTHTVKTDFGWLDPRDNSGNLKLTIDGERGGEHYGTERDPQMVAFNAVLRLAEEHGIYAANGGMQTG
jgi:hypothetical protein